MQTTLSNFYGSLLLVRPPAPVTINKAGANYKSEVTHTEYSPRLAYMEWLSICDAIVELGGDALFNFEAEDEPFLGHEALHIDAQGQVLIAGTTTVLGDLRQIHTGRVFTANGPWVRVEGTQLRVLLPHMLAHRLDENAYYRRILAEIAEQSGYELHIKQSPHRWEGLADVVVLDDKVLFTYTTREHYHPEHGAKTLRSSLEGARYAADFAGLEGMEKLFLELVYPHFHGDTVHFALRLTERNMLLLHYAAGLWSDDQARLRDALGKERIVPIAARDAVQSYAANSRQVHQGVLVPKGVSTSFCDTLTQFGLIVKNIGVTELFGKAGGGPACATLFLPQSLKVHPQSEVRYSQQRELAKARAPRIAARLTVDPGYYAHKARG